MDAFIILCAEILTDDDSGSGGESCEESYVSIDDRVYAADCRQGFLSDEVAYYYRVNRVV